MFDKKLWSKEYYLKNKERLLKRSKEWNKKNKAAMKAIRKKWRINNPDKNRQLAKSWAKRNMDYVLHNAKIQRDRRKGAEGSHTLKEWNELKKKYNYTCKECKKSEPEIKLTVDHYFPILHGGNNYIDNIQPLCLSCNCSKGATIPAETE